MPKFNLKKLDDINAAKQAFILDSEVRFNTKIEGLQKSLLDMILNEYIVKFDTKNGVLMDTDKNVSLLAEIDKLFDKFNTNFQQSVLSGYAKDLLKITELNADYFSAGLGFATEKINDIVKNKINLDDKLGFTAKGNLKRDGYLYKLGETQPVRQELKQYVANSLTSEVSYSEYLNGFKQLVVGNENVKGSLVKYYDQYAYDSFNQHDASSGLYMAKDLGLEHFMYEGSIIKTSRQFCIDRAGKVFSIKDTKKWKDDPHLIDKKTKATYKPLIERGRYRCRHFLKWLSKELYDYYIKKQNK